MPRILFGVLVIMTMMLAPPLAAQTPRDEAVKLADQAFDLMEQGRPGDAAEKFKEAAKLYYSPVIALYWAKAEAKQGKLLEARDIAITIENKPLPPDAKPSWTKAVEDAAAFRKSLEARIPTLTIQVTGTDSSDVAINGNAAVAGQAIPLDPGAHEVAVTAADGETKGETVSLGEGEARTLSIGFTPDVPTADTSLIGPIIGYSIGGVGLIIGVVTGVIFMGKADELDETCPDDVCPPDQEDLLDDTKTLGNVSTAGWVIAGVGIAAGTVLLFVPLGTEKAAVEIGAGSVGISGRF